MKIVYVGALVLTACNSSPTATAPASIVGSTSAATKTVGDSGSLQAPDERAMTPSAADAGTPSRDGGDGGAGSLDAGGPSSVLGTHRDSDWAEWPMPSKAHPPSYTLNDAGTIVTDNVTGLVWPREAAFEQDGGVREVSLEGAVAFCESFSLGGNTDWRLPSAIELYSIINLEASYPALGPPFTPDAAGVRSSTNQGLGDIWSTTIAGHDVIAVDFDGAQTGTEDRKLAGVRCVRQRATAPSSGGARSSTVGDATYGGPPMNSRYELRSPKVVYDTKTKLLWDRTGSTKEMTLEAAAKYCQNAALDGSAGTGWRLPEEKELVTLIDYSAATGKMHSSSTIDLRAFPGTHRDDYWSSTERRWGADSAHQWIVDFAHGFADSKPVPVSDAFVRCVRDTAAPPELKSAAPATSSKNP